LVKRLLWVDNAGSLQGTQVAGEIECDNVVNYAVPLANERGVISVEQFISTQGGTYTLTSQTAAQKLFNNPSSGQITLGASRSYHFECQFDLTSTAASGNFGFLLGGTAGVTFVKWLSIGNKAALATAASPQATMNVTVSNNAIVTATTNTVGWAYVRGLLRVSTTGTIIPQISLSVAAAAVVGQDSFFRMWPIGTNTVKSIGNWN
jgi:hypothetical protein